MPTFPRRIKPYRMGTPCCLIYHGEEEGRSVPVCSQSTPMGLTGSSCVATFISLIMDSQKQRLKRRSVGTVASVRRGLSNHTTIPVRDNFNTRQLGKNLGKHIPSPVTELNDILFQITVDSVMSGVDFGVWIQHQTSGRSVRVSEELYKRTLRYGLNGPKVV